MPIDPRLTAGPSMFDRLEQMESRLAALEANTHTGILGTDQTIKGSHDRLDALMGAGVAEPDGTMTGDLAMYIASCISSWAGVQVWVSGSGDNQVITDTAYEDVTDSIQTIEVLPGDVVVSIASLVFLNDVIRQIAALFILNLGGDASQRISMGVASATDRRLVTLVFARIATVAATWSVRIQAQVANAGDNTTIGQQQMVSIRFRRGE
jgi:hypothetical protein